MDDSPEVQVWRERAVELAGLMAKDAMDIITLMQSTELPERQLLMKLHSSAREPLELATLATHSMLSRTSAVKMNKHQLIEKLFDKLRPPT